MRNRMGPWILVGAIAALCPAEAGDRVALVIGNNAYEHVRALDNPRNDAEAVSGVLRQLGFRVTLKTDADLRSMKDGLREFVDRLPAEGGGDHVALIYFAGHGVQISGRNYLIPTDAKMEREYEVPDETLSMDLVMRALEFTGTGLNLLILDCCRNDPFSRATRATGSGGLAAPRGAPRGLFVAFATSPGEVAADGSGEHSPYTEALVRHLPTPGVPFEETSPSSPIRTRLRRGNPLKSREPRPGSPSPTRWGWSFFPCRAARGLPVSHREPGPGFSGLLRSHRIPAAGRRAPVPRRGESRRGIHQPMGPSTLCFVAAFGDSGPERRSPGSVHQLARSAGFLRVAFADGGPPLPPAQRRGVVRSGGIAPLPLGRFVSSSAEGGQLLGSHRDPRPAGPLGGKCLRGASLRRFLRKNRSGGSLSGEPSRVLRYGRECVGVVRGRLPSRFECAGHPGGKRDPAGELLTYGNALPRAAGGVLGQFRGVHPEDIIPRFRRTRTS